MQDDEPIRKEFVKLENHLTRRLEFEKLIFRLSSRLSIVEEVGIGKTLEPTLIELIDLIGAPRAFLLLYNKKNNVFSHFYEWNIDGIQSNLHILKQISKNAPLWLNDTLKKGEYVDLLPDGELGIVNERIKPLLQKLDVKKYLVYPIFINLETEGFLLFNEAKSIEEWDEDDKNAIQTISQIIGSAIDRSLYEEKLRKSEQKYRSVLESIKEAYYEVDLKGNFKFFNYALCNITGYSKNELLGKNYKLFLQDDSIDHIFNIFHSVYEQKVNRDRVEFQIKRKDGKRVYIESSIYLRRDSNNQRVGFHGFMYDITERKKAEELKEKFAQSLQREVKIRTSELEEALDQQKKYLDQILKASQFKSEFMATMSHELRTPLNAIIGFSELLLEGLYGDLNDDQLSFIRDVHSSAEHLLEMINRILDISKIEAGRINLNLEPVLLNDLMEKIHALIKPLYQKKKLDFHVHGLDENIIIYVDVIRFKEILFNLLSNAIKYTDEGTINLVVQDKRDKYEISVIDTGIGIDEKDHYLVFKEFERIETTNSNTSQGTGLGLPLAKRLANLHGGDITFTSKLGKGSTFLFTLPKKLGDIEENSDEVNILKKANKVKPIDLDLLLVEDTRKDALLIQKILGDITDFNFNVIWRENLNDSISYLENNKVDVVLLDISLPDSNGLGTVSKILENAQEFPIIVLTVKDDESFASRVVSAGAQDYLVKSEVNGHVVSRAIRYAIERHKHITRSD